MIPAALCLEGQAHTSLAPKSHAYERYTESLESHNVQREDKKGHRGWRS